MRFRSGTASRVIMLLCTKVHAIKGGISWGFDLEKVLRLDLFG